MKDGGRSGSRALRIAAIGAAIGIVLVAGGMIALRMILTPERLRAETIRRTADATGLAVELDAASLSFLPFGVQIDGLRVAAPAPGRPPLLALRSGVVRLDLWALLSRNVVVERIALDGPVVSVAEADLEKQAQPPADGPATGKTSGRSNAASRGAAAIAGSFRGAIEQLEVTDGTVLLLTTGGEQDLSLRGIHLRARVEATQGADEVRAEGRLQLRELEVAALAPYRKALDALEPSLTFELVLLPLANRLEVRSLELATNAALGSLGVQGALESVNRPAAARFDLRATADLDLAAVSRAGLVPDDVEIAGRVRGAVGGRGALERPAEAEISGELTVEGLAASGAALPVPLSDGSVRAVLQEGDIDLPSISLRAGRSRFSGKGHLARALVAPTLTLQGRSERLDLTEWTPAPASGGAARTPGSRDAPGLPGRTGPPLLPPLPPIAADVRLEVDSLVTEDATLTGATMTIALADGVARVEGRVREGRFGRGVKMSDLSANVDVQGQTMRGTFRSPLVEAHRVPLTDVKGRVDLAEDRQLHIRDATASVWTGRAEGTAVIDLTDPAAPAFTIESRGVDLQANDFVSGLTPARDFLFGRLDVRSSFSGKGATPDEVAASLTGSGDVTAREGRLNRGPQTRAIWNALQLGERESIPFRDLVTAFRVDQGRVITDNLVLGGSDANWKASGSVGFTGDLKYGVEVELSEKLSGQFRQRVGSDLAKLLSGSTGRIVLNLDIGGTVQRPSVSLDRDRLAKRAAENASDALKDELKKGKEKLGDALKNLLGGKK